MATAVPTNDPRLCASSVKSASRAAAARNSPESSGCPSRWVDIPNAAIIPIAPSAAFPFA